MMAEPTGHHTSYFQLLSALLIQLSETILRIAHGLSAADQPC